MKTILYTALGLAIVAGIAGGVWRLLLTPGDLQLTEYSAVFGPADEPAPEGRIGGAPRDLAAWNRQVRAAIAARRPTGVSGEATVAFTVAGDGRVASASASGDDEMRGAALRSVRAAAIPAPPDGRAHTFTIRFH